MSSLIRVVIELLEVYKLVLIASVAAFWLIRYKVIDAKSEVVKTISTVLTRLTEPVLAPVRRRLPDFGGLDLSPIAVIFGIHLLQILLSGH